MASLEVKSLEAGGLSKRIVGSPTEIFKSRTYKYSARCYAYKFYKALILILFNNKNK